MWPPVISMGDWNKAMDLGITLNYCSLNWNFQFDSPATQSPPGREIASLSWIHTLSSRILAWCFALRVRPRGGSKFFVGAGYCVLWFVVTDLEALIDIYAVYPQSPTVFHEFLYRFIKAVESVWGETYNIIVEPLVILYCICSVRVEVVAVTCWDFEGRNGEIRDLFIVKNMASFFFRGFSVRARARAW